MDTKAKNLLKINKIAHDTRKKKIGGQVTKFEEKCLEFGHPQKSWPINKVLWQFYTYPENTDLIDRIWLSPGIFLGFDIM